MAHIMVYDECSVRMTDPKRPTRTPLHKAATQGDLDQLNALIDHDPSTNIYETNEDDEALLADVIRARHTQIAHRLLDVYETDLNTVQKFFDQHDVVSNFWLTKPILVSCGATLCDAVEQLTTESVRLPRFVANDDRHGLIVLLKRDRTEPKVLWLSPGTSNKDGDDRIIAKIVELIYAEHGGGLLGVQLSSSSLLGLAAMNGMTDVFIRLHNTFGETLALDICTEYMPLLCHLANYSEDHLVGLQSLVDQLGAFQLDEIYNYSDAWRVLEVPLKLKQTELFAHMLAEIASAQNIAPRAVLNDLLQQSNYLGLNSIWSKNAADLAPFVASWVANDVDFLLPHANERKWHPIQMLLEQRTIPDAQLADIIIMNNERIGALCDIALAIFNRLADMERFAVIRQWFSQCTMVPALLFSKGYHLSNRIAKCISSNSDRMAFAEFLFDSCASKLSARCVTSLMLGCAEHSAASSMLRKLLLLPQCVDVAAGWQPWGDARSPMFTALMNRCPANYQLLFDSVRDKSLICAMKEYNDDSILAVAMWSRDTIRDLFVFEGYMCAEDESPSTIIANTKSDEECDAERAQYDRIFESLLDLGCSAQHVNESGQTLVHFAALNDNLIALRRLLALGLDPNRPDGDGNLPIHLVRSVATFHELLQAAGGADVLRVTNAHGMTPLSVVSSASVRIGTSERTKPLLDAMRAAAEEYSSASSKSDQKSTLHEVYDNAQLTKWWLANGADINAVNSRGETALHRLSQLVNIEVLEAMLAAPGLDWSKVSCSGTTYLSLLVGLSEAHYERIRPLLEPYQMDIDRLFREHCNSKDVSGIPVLHTAIRSDTNAECLRRLLEHRDRLNLSNIVIASVGDEAALQLAIEMSSISVEQRTANITSAALSHSLGHPYFDNCGPCVTSVRALIAAGAPVTGVNFQKRTLVNWTLDQLSVAGRRKLVVTCVAALIAAGADFAGLPGPSADALRNTTVLGCLLEH